MSNQFFDDHLLEIGPNLPLGIYRKSFRFLLKIFFLYQFYPGLERFFCLFLIPGSSNAERFRIWRNLHMMGFLSVFS